MASQAMRLPCPFVRFTMAPSSSTVSRASLGFLVVKAERRGKLDGDTGSSWAKVPLVCRHKSKPIFSLMNSVMSDRALENGEVCPGLSLSSYSGKKLARGISFSILSNVAPPTRSWFCRVSRVLFVLGPPVLGGKAGNSQKFHGPRLQYWRLVKEWIHLIVLTLMLCVEVMSELIVAGAVVGI